MIGVDLESHQDWATKSAASASRTVLQHAEVTFSFTSPKRPAIDMTGTSSPAEEALLLMLRRGNWNVHEDVS